MSNTSTQQQDRVVIAVDSHKASWTAAAVGAGLTPLATLRVPVSQQGYRQLRRFAARWPDAVWAIEGAIGLGAPLATRLSADGIDAVDVPAKLAARVRTLSTGHGRKSDSDDAVSVGIAALTAVGLRGEGGVELSEPGDVMGDPLLGQLRSSGVEDAELVLAAAPVDADERRPAWRVVVGQEKLLRRTDPLRADPLRALIQVLVARLPLADRGTTTTGRDESAAGPRGSRCQGPLPVVEVDQREPPAAHDVDG